jgi:hypothetical protein
MRHARTLGSCSFVVAALVLAACKGDKEQAPRGTPPPSVATAPSGAGSVPVKGAGCDPASVGIADAKVASLLPATVEGFCVTKADPVRSWGEGTGKKIEDVSDIIDGAGEIYSRDYYAKRYDSLKYVDGSGSGAEVEIALTTYEKPENAYGLFTYRAVANADPDPEAAKAQGRTPMRIIGGAGAAALGNASAIAWKGPYLVELTYSPDPTKTAAEATAAADKILPKFVEAIGEKLLGTVEAPPEVRALPGEDAGRIVLGIDYVPAKFKRPEGKTDALHVNAGAYAQAYMREGKKRWRVLSFVREEREPARDAFQAFAKLPGALPIKDAKEWSEEAVHFPFTVGQGGAGAAGKAEGVAARKGTVVYAVIDEELALGDASQKDDYPRLSKDEKLAKLKALLARPTTPPK